MTSGNEKPTLLVDVASQPNDIFLTVKRRIEAARKKCKCKERIRDGDASPVQRMERVQRGREMPWIKKREAGVNSKPDLGYWFIKEMFQFQDNGMSLTDCGSYPETYPDIYSDGSGRPALDWSTENGIYAGCNSLDMEPDVRNICPLHYSKAEGVGKFATSQYGGSYYQDSFKFNGKNNVPYEFCTRPLEPWKDVSNAPHHIAKCGSPRTKATAEIAVQR